MKKLFLTLLLPLGMCFTFASCGGCSENQKVTVTFKQEGQTDIVKTLDMGGNITDVPMPIEKIGYTVKWDRTVFSNLTADIVVNAVETANTYTITYEANGGKVENATQDVTYDADIILETPRRDTYDFLGWYYGETLINDGKWTIPNDVTLVANWKQQDGYTITFVQGEQSKKVWIKKGTSILETDVPELIEKTGYTVAWDKLNFYDIQSDTTVSAVYTPNTYEAIYNAEGFSINGEKVQLTYDAPCTDLNVSLQKEGFTFLGWTYNGVTYTEKDIWKVAKNNVILTPQWVENGQVAITFVDTDGTGIMKTLYLGESLTEIPTPSIKTGYNVDTENWYTDSACKNIATFEAVMESVTVYAKATANTYIITYNANGGTLTQNRQEVTYDSYYSLLEPIHVESYMRFDGWKDENDNIIPVTGKWTIAENKNLVAEWTDTRNTYTISFVQSGQQTKTFTVKEGENFTAIPTPIAKKGYTVVWDKSEFINIDANITVNAIETPKTYTVTLNANGGTVSSTPISVTYGQAYELSTPTHNDSNKVFKGWLLNGVEISTKGTWNIDAEDSVVELTAWWGDKVPWTNPY